MFGLDEHLFFVSLIQNCRAAGTLLFVRTNIFVPGANIYSFVRPNIWTAAGT